MKMKKYGIFLLLVMVLAVSTFVIPALAADETVYYVNSDGTGDYTDLFEAINALPDEGGKVVVCSNLTVSGSSNPTTHTLKARAGKVTVTGEGYDSTITFSGSAKHVIDCYCAIEFNNLTLNHAASASTEFYGGPSLIIGENMTFLAKGSAITAGYNSNNGAICFRGGNYKAACDSTRMEFYSGQFSYIQCGNGSYAVTSAEIIVHSGVTVMDFIQCGATRKTVGDVTCTIDGATVGYVYLGGYSDSKGTSTVTGDITLNVENATITAIYGERSTTFQGAGSSTYAGSVAGNINVTLDNSSVTTVDLSNLTASGSKNLTFQNCENTTVGDSLSDFDSVTLTASTVTLTEAYAGPTPTVDETSTLTDTTGVVAGNGSEGDGETPDPDVPAGENIVFLSGEVSSSGNGTTPATAVKTLLEAYNALGEEGGTIILCGDLTETFAAKSFTDYPAKAVVITSKFGDYDYTDKVFTMHNPGSSRATLQFCATTLFANIHLNETASSNKAIEFFTGPKLVFGEGVVCTYNGGEIDTSANGRFAVRTGFHDKAYVAADYNNQPATFWMQSGTLSFIQGGNHSNSVDNSYICLEGTAKITVMVQGGGTNANVGTSKIEIKSNAQIPQLYVNGYGSAAMTSSEIAITGGTVGAINAARSSATGKLGDVTMSIGGTASIGTVDLESGYLTTGTQSLTLEEGWGDRTISGGFGSGWDTIDINTGSDITINGALTVGSASVTVGENTTVYISDSANTSVPSYTGEGRIVLTEAPDHTHSGSMFAASTLLSMGEGSYDNYNVQGTAIYQNYLVRCGHGGGGYIYDLSSSTPGDPIAFIKLASFDNSGSDANHANQMMFGATKFDESDPFPLLYVTTGNTGAHDSTGAYYAKCSIERILYSETDGWYCEQVQVIEFNDYNCIPGTTKDINTSASTFIDGMYKDGKFMYVDDASTTYDESQWEKVGWGWHASFVDSDPTSATAGKFYLHSARFRTTTTYETYNKDYYGIGDYMDVIDEEGHTVNAYIITEFNMPALPTSEDDPNYGGTVTLYPADIQDQFEIPYKINGTQGGTMYQGKLFYSYGFSASDNGFQVIDMEKQELVTYSRLATLVDSEPECCCITEDGKLAISFQNHKVYVFDYYMMDVSAQAPTCTEDGVVAHAVCSACDGIYYSQTDYTTVLNSIADEAAGHDLTHFTRNEATETEDGNIEYWYCSACGKYFSDEACANEITKAQTVIPATVGKPGDADGDGDVDEDDAAAIKRYRAGLIDASGLKLELCDLDGNEVVDVYDAYLIQLYLADVISSFPGQSE